MNKSFGKKLVELYKSGRAITLVQLTYVLIFIVFVVTAGLISLIKQAVGIAFLIVPLICLISFCMNLVAYSVIKTAIEFFYPEVNEKEVKKAPAKRTTKKTSTKKSTKKTQK